MKLRTVNVKIQTVETHQVEVHDGSGYSVGGYIDDILADTIRQKRMPNKLTVDINPPDPADEANQI